MWEVGDLLMEVNTGVLRRITRISEPGTFGTAHSAGRIYHATVTDHQRRAIPRGHTAEIWSGSLSYPTANWSKVEEA